jgi:hypothetical protein
LLALSELVARSALLVLSYGLARSGTMGVLGQRRLVWAFLALSYAMTRSGSPVHTYV